jgi:hypothetical protein
VQPNTKRWPKATVQSSTEPSPRGSLPRAPCQRARHERNGAPPPGSNLTAITAHGFATAPHPRRQPYPRCCLAAATLPPYATKRKGKCLFPSHADHAAPPPGLNRGTTVVSHPQFPLPLLPASTASHGHKGCMQGRRLLPFASSPHSDALLLIHSSAPHIVLPSTAPHHQSSTRELHLSVAWPAKHRQLPP